MRRETETGMGIHTGGVDITEVRTGDTVVVSLPSEITSKTKLELPGWRQVGSVNPKSALAAATAYFPHSIFNENGESFLGENPAPLENWQRGYGFVMEPDLQKKNATHKLLIKLSEDKFVLLMPSDK